MMYKKIPNRYNQTKIGHKCVVDLRRTLVSNNALNSILAIIEELWVFLCRENMAFKEKLHSHTMFLLKRGFLHDPNDYILFYI